MTKTAPNDYHAAGTPADSQAILKWLESPSAPHPAEELPTLRAHLTGLRQAPGALQQKAVALDGLYARASGVVAGLLPTLTERALPVAPKTRRLVRSIVDLLQVMADETLALVEQLDPQHQPSVHHPSLSPTLALWRSLQASAQQLMVCHLIAAPSRVGAWQQLHQTYATAQRLHLAAAVPDGLDSSLQHVYHAAVLLGCAHPASLTPPEVVFLTSYFERFADHLEPASATAAASPGTFWIDPTRDLPASSSQRKASPQTAPIEYFSCARLCLLLDDMIQEWDMELLDPINADTRLIEDLGFESVDLMQLIVAIEQAFGARGLPYEKALMQDGGYVTEISVGQLAQFLSDNLPGTVA